MRTIPNRCAASPAQTTPTSAPAPSPSPAPRRPSDRAPRDHAPRPTFQRPEPIKVCPCCGRPAATLFRCKTRLTDQPGAGWQAACAICLAHLSDDNPHFVYGGVIRNRPHFYIPRPHAVSRAA